MVGKLRLAIPFVAAGIFALMSGCDHSASKTKDAPKTPQPFGLIPLSEYDGRIQHVVFHSADDLVGPAWRSVFDLLTAMPADTRFTFVCDTEKALRETRGRLRQWKFGDRENIVAHLVQQPLSVWARDRYIAMKPTEIGKPPTWLVPQVVPSRDSERRNREREVPKLLNEIEPYCRIAESVLVLEGGNVMASNRHVFVGNNALRENAPAGSPVDAEAALAELFGLPVVLVGDDRGSPPIAHVDMFITPIADDHVLVGSPTLAAEVMKDADPASADALKRRLFITPDVPGGVDAGFAPQRAARFDQAARRLRDQGLQVTRIAYVDSRDGAFAVTYNNVIQEKRDGRHIVYMPIYKIPALDAAAQEVYESLGMTVKPIDVTPICHLLGAVRCLANVVERAEE